MSLAVTSIITWCCLRPLIAANMPRIMGGIAPGSGGGGGGGDLGDRARVDPVDCADRELRGAALGDDLLDDARVGDLLAVEVGDGLAEQAERLAHPQVGRDGVVG